jgi:hypothetical protein
VIDPFPLYNKATTVREDAKLTEFSRLLLGRGFLNGSRQSMLETIDVLLIRLFLDKLCVDGVGVGRVHSNRDNRRGLLRIDRKPSQRLLPDGRGGGAFLTGQGFENTLDSIANSVTTVQRRPRLFGSSKRSLLIMYGEILNGLPKAFLLLVLDGLL